MSKTTLIADTGAIVALLDKSDSHHPWALHCFRALRPPLLTCDAVLAEAWHLLGYAEPSRDVLLALCRSDTIRSAFTFAQQSAETLKLLEKYRETPMDLADACLVRMSELQTDCQIWTVDSDFKIYRRNGRHVVPTLAPWS